MAVQLLFTVSFPEMCGQLLTKAELKHNQIEPTWIYLIYTNAILLTHESMNLELPCIITSNPFKIVIEKLKFWILYFHKGTS